MFYPKCPQLYPPRPPCSGDQGELSLAAHLCLHSAGTCNTQQRESGLHKVTCNAQIILECSNKEEKV